MSAKKKLKGARSKSKDEQSKIELTNEHLTRQLDILPLSSLKERITIIGAGAIGSFTTLALAKMGFTDLTVYDDDKIEIENMNCQFYRFSDIGKFKVEALKELVKDFTNVDIHSETSRYVEGTFPGVVISAVDNMAVRRTIWENHKALGVATKFIIDPRMGAETALLFTMNPMNDEDISDYETTLYSDDDAVQERCTAKATMYTACMLSGLVAKTVKDIVTSGSYSRTANWAIDGNVFQAWSPIAKTQRTKDKL